MGILRVCDNRNIRVGAVMCGMVSPALNRHRHMIKNRGLPRPLKKWINSPFLSSHSYRESLKWDHRTPLCVCTTETQYCYQSIW